MNRKLSCSLVMLIVVFMIPVVCHAEGAGVLPKGVGSYQFAYFNFADIEERFDPQGKKEPLAINLNGALNSNIIPLLRPLDGAVAGLANIGDLQTKFTDEVEDFAVRLRYGLTSRLTVGVVVPWSNRRRVVEANIDSSTANVGKSASGFCAGFVGPTICPLGVGDTVALTNEDGQALLGPGLDIDGNGVVDVAGFGFKRLETTDRTELLNIRAFGKYQYLKKSPWRLAVTAGFSIPTGKASDPDSLSSLGFGSGHGQWDLSFRHHADYLGIKKLRLSLDLGYKAQLPDKERRRVRSDANSPVSDVSEVLDRDLGDIVSVIATGGYAFTPEWSFTTAYFFAQKFRNNIKGVSALCCRGLESETASQDHRATFAVSFSTVDMFLKKQFPVPFNFTVAYRKRLYGTNNVKVSEFVSFALTSYFRVPYFAEKK